MSQENQITLRKLDTAQNDVVATSMGQSIDLDPISPKIDGEWTVDKVLSTILEGAPEEGSSSPVPFFHILERLKTTKREGWRRLGIQRSRGESISDHMYRMALISMFAPPVLASKLDISKCIKMCLIHDMAEALVGDITPVDGVSKPEKSRRESEAMDYLCKRLLGHVDKGDVGEMIRTIWQEYEDSITAEAIFVHDIDKIELLLQMVEYERRGNGKIDLGEFAYVSTNITLPECQAWAKQILDERTRLWGSTKHTQGDQGVEGGLGEDHIAKVNAYYLDR